MSKQDENSHNDTHKLRNVPRTSVGAVFNQDILYQLLEEARAAALMPETDKSRVLELHIEEEYNPPHPKISEYTLQRDAFRKIIAQPFHLFQTNEQDGQNT